MSNIDRHDVTHTNDSDPKALCILTAHDHLHGFGRVSRAVGQPQLANQNNEEISDQAPQHHGAQELLSLLGGLYGNPQDRQRRRSRLRQLAPAGAPAVRDSTTESRAFDWAKRNPV